MKFDYYYLYIINLVDNDNNKTFLGVGTSKVISS